jgi:phosphoribosylaminoimidazole carboxylase
VPFIRELAVMVVCGRGGEVQTYPVVETVQQDNICKVVIAPAQISSSIATRAQAIAKDVVAGLKGAGVYGVELFLLADGQVLVNEIAPRTHNSGHYTIEACYTSQFENHIRAVSGLPIGCCDLKVGASVMVNVLGKDTMQETLAPCVKALTMDGATIHMYGKSENRAGRKMGHITICRATMEEARVAANILLDSSGDQRVAISDADARPLVGVIMGSDSDLGYLSILIVRVMKPAAQILKDFGIPFELTIVSAHRTPDRMMEYTKSARVRGLKVIIAAAGV